MSSSGTAIWWIRRDLRLNNNRALEAAAHDGRTVVPVFVLDPRFKASQSDKRMQFLYSGLRSLDADLSALGSQLIVKSGDPTRVLPELSRSLEAPVFAEEDFTPYARARDQQVASAAELNLVGGLTVFHPEEVLTERGGPFKVFSRFKTKWQSLSRQGAVTYDPRSIDFVSKGTHESVGIPEVTGNVQAGEDHARKAFDQFLVEDGAIWKYGEDRSRVDRDSTSGLSPFIKFGMVSTELLVEKATKLLDDETLPAASQASVRTWLSELIWREFFQAALYHFPDSVNRSLRPEFEGIDWNDPADHLTAWQQGMTGYPIVDAAMRQLSAAGWIHNRCRMIVASFLVKDLLIDWRHGATWFMKHLVDGDIAANIGGWQWTAGTGLDAAPYFRVFNPVLQGKKFDPNGEYVRKWIPELQGIADRYVHEPWESLSTGSNSKSINGYPLPIVDHREARKTTLDAFEKARSRHRSRTGNGN